MKKFLVAFMTLVMAVLLVGCGKGKDNNYIGDKVALHRQYNVTIKSATTVDEIQVKETTDGELVTKSEEGVKYIAVDLTISRNADSKTQYKLKTESFKLKDHTGLAITKVYKKNLNKISFKTTEAITDYTWVGTTLDQGESKDLTIYFEAPKIETKDNDGNVTEVKYITNDDYILVVEADLALLKTGVDIVLTAKTEETEPAKTTTKAATTVKTTTAAQTTTQAAE